METDVIQNVFSHVFDDKNSEMVYDRNANTKEYWNSDILDESYGFIWSSDKFTKACSRLAKRCKHIDETLRAPLTADILACLKFETGADVQTSETTCRRMLFSTGFSISVENLFPCDSETDINAANSCEFLLNDSDFHHVEDEDYVSVTHEINKVGEQILCSGDLDDQCDFYSNPFDPKLTFEGLTQVYNPIPDIGADAAMMEYNGPNFLLAFDDPSSLVCEYLGAYRNYVRHMSHDIHPVTKKSPTESNQGHKEVEEIAKRNAYDLESKTLFSKVINTKELWSQTETFGTSDEIPVQHIEIGGYEVSEHEDIKNEVTVEKNTDADTRRTDSTAELVSTMKSEDKQSLGSKNRSTKTEPNIENSTENELIKDKFESSCDELKSVDDIIDRVSRRYPSQNYSRKEIHQMLVTALKNRNKTKSQQESETGNEISTPAQTSCCAEEMEAVNSKINSGQSGFQIVERDAALETAENMENSNKKESPRGSDISQKYQPQQNGTNFMDQQQEPLLRYPYDSSIFWKENEFDPTPFNSVQYHLPNVLQPPTSASNFKPVFNEKDYIHPKTHFSPQFLLPHYQPQFPQIESRPPHQNGYVRVQGQNQRGMAPFYHQLQQPHQQMFKHYHQTPQVQNSFRKPPPTLHHQQPFLGLSMTSNQPMHATFPVQQSYAQNVSNQNALANCRPQSPALNSSTKQQFNHPMNIPERSKHSNFTLNQQISQEAIQTKNKFEPELHMSEFAQNTKPSRSEPTFILPCLSVPPPTLPCIPNSSVLHHIRPYQTSGESQVLHHTDPNFRLDDEIWYINGIPHRHARPIHNLHSVMPFYPYNEYKGSDVNKCGINRRIAEQVAKINQTYNEPIGMTSKARFADSSMALEAHNVTKPKVNSENSEGSDTITLYPVYSTMMGANSGNSYQRFQKNKSHNCHDNINNNNFEMANDSHSVTVGNFKDIVLSDDEMTCSRDFAFNTKARDVCNDTKRRTVDEKSCLGFRSISNADRTNASVIHLVSNKVDGNRGLEGCNLPSVDMNKETEMRKTNFGCNFEDGSYAMTGPGQNNNHFSVKTSDKMDGHDCCTTKFTEDHETSLLAESRRCESKPATLQQSQPQPMDKKPNDIDLETRTGDIRCIPVLGRIRNQKDNEPGVRKRKDISRKVLLQLV